MIDLKITALWTKRYKAAFISIITIYTLTIFTTFQDYGITIDEPPHAGYGSDIISWYLSGFQNNAFLDAENMLFYGGFFDMLVHPITIISPFNLHDTRHLCNALVGLLAIIAVYRLGCYIGSPSIGLLAAIFIIFIPRFYGHIFNNPKDIPFATFYIWSLYFLIQCIDQLPHLSKRLMVLTATSIGLTLSVRVGGLVLFGYMALAFGLIYMLHLKQSQNFQSAFLIRSFAVPFIAIGIMAYVIMLTFWPRALIDPIDYPIKVLRIFSNFTYYVTTFFNGEEIKSVEIPWYYAPQWLGMALPEFLWFGIIFGLIWIFIARPWKTTSHLRCIQWGTVVISAFFPPIYAIVKGSPLYDGLRHFLFILPPLALISAAGVIAIIHSSTNIWLKRTMVGLFASLLLLTAWDMIRLHPNQYIYFNRLIAGGLQKAAKSYQTDYWENSYKQGVQWISQQYTRWPADRKLRIGAASDNIQFLLDDIRFEYVPVPDPEKMDLYLSVTRANGHRMVPGEIIHTIDADAVPLLYIIKPDSSFNGDPFFASVYDRDFILGWRAHKMGWHETAEKAYRRIVADGTNDPIIYNNLAGAYLALNQKEEAVWAYREAVKLEPKYLKAQHNLLETLLELKRFDEAIPTLRQIIAMQPENKNYFLALGNLLFELGRYAEAEPVYRQYLQLDNGDPNIHYNLGLTLHRQERYAEAVQAFQTASELAPNDIEIHLQWAESLRLSGDPDAAIAVYKTILERHPAHSQTLQKSSALLLEQNHPAEALDLFNRALAFNSASAETWYLLAHVYQEIDDLENLQTALQNAVRHAPQERLFLESYLNLGGTLQQRGNFDDARKIYLEIIAYAPNLPDVHINMGILNFSQHRYGEASENFSRATQLAPGDPETHLGLAQAYEKTGQITQARAAYQRVLELQPENPMAQTRLRELK